MTETPSEPHRLSSLTPAGATVVTAAASFGLVALTLYMLVVGQEILIPLVLALFITYLIAALGRRFQRIRLGRRHIPDWLGLALATLVLVLVAAVTVQIAASNLSDVVSAAPGYQDRLQGMFTEASTWAAETLRLSKPLTLAALTEQIDLSSVIERFALGLRSIAANTLQVLIYVAFMLLELRTFDIKLKAIFTDPNREKTIRKTLVTMGRKIETYVLIKSTISLLNSMLTYAILRFLGIDFAGFWALLVLVLYFIPYIGSPLSILFPTVLALLQFGALAPALMVMASMAAVLGFVENFIEPRITGRSLNLSPVVVIVSLSLWGAMWGITGMILSVPLMVIVVIMLAQFPKTRPIAVLMSANGDVS